ncbi:hypothetical protein AK812_SmicGene41561 [Symbiodinium microadriaticum]|uniref:Uncharacterized protein n=1 Tax=Symbiodinium microadriaticum TaxID=2951 RepID=A0A1Q9C5S7_SYMMI|nr:hypothetical protein AK812_SmicGene41561 [Symbiodinium microadriaticum]
MTDLTREELRLALRQVGEDPPMRWTKPELRLRLEQVTGEDMSKKVKKETVEQSPYEELVKRMNAASRRKQDLIEFCHKELRMTNLDRMTIAMIQHAAMYKIYEMAPMHPSDLVGFGKHGRMTYRALRQQEPGYAKWVKETARNDEGKNLSDPRLIRVARWLENEGDEEMIPATKKIDYKNLAITKAKSKARGSQDGYAPTEATSSNPEDTALDLMKNMCQAIEDLKNEVAVLKQEPRRKTSSKEEEPTDAKGSMAVAKGCRVGLRDGPQEPLLQKGWRLLTTQALPSGERVWGDCHEIRHRILAFNPKAVQDFCDRNNIYHDNIPADGHWQIGVCEQAVQGVKSVMTKLVADNDEVTPEEALSQAVHVFNARDHVRGFSPIQHAFGRSPDTTGRLLENHDKVPEELVVESATEEFERSARLRAEAEKAHAQWHMEQRISRALNSRSKPVYDFRPGELVYFWRTQESGQGRRQPGSKHGKFLGPARVLATETRRESDGTLRPGSAVWCVRGRSLLKCCPEQLRHASEREELLEGLARDHGEEETPWTFTKVAEEIGGNQYQDISNEKPDDREWSRSQNIQEEAPPVRYRFRGKRAEPEPADEIMREPEERSQPSQPSRPRVHQAANFTDRSEKWTDKVPKEAWTGEPVAFWRDATAAVEVEIAMPETRRTWEKATNNLQAFFAGALKRRAVEAQRFTGNRHALDPYLEIEGGGQCRKEMCLERSSKDDNILDTPEISLSSARRKDLKAPTTDWEKSKLRGVLGAISWHAQQVSPHLSAEVSLLLSEVNCSTVETVIKTNQFLCHAKAKKDHQLKIHRFPEGTELGAYTWVDAGSQNRPDGGSTQGVLIGLAPTSLLQGEVCPVSIMAWHSNKIERVCRSPGAAETQAAISGEDLMYYLRYQWGELLYGVADAKDPDSTVRKVPGCVISDSRNVFDKLQTEVVTIKGAERKANIELLSLKEAQLRTQVEVRWVHSEAQLANSLTKANGGKEIELFYRMNGRWRIVEDEQMRSARRRKTEGLEPLQQEKPEVTYHLLLIFLHVSLLTFIDMEEVAVRKHLCHAVSCQSVQ